jgi:hypothetical protein
MEDKEIFDAMWHQVKYKLVGFLLAVVMCGILTLLLGSCTTKKVVTDRYVTDTLRIVQHDTIRTHKSDTVRDVRLVMKTDTVKEQSIRVVTLREGGDTIRDVVTNNIYRYVYRSDSTDRYRSVADSLQAVIDKMSKESKTKTVTKEVVKTKSLVPLWLQVISVGVFIFCIIIVARDISKKIG